jgi:hypothetical protein
MKKYNSFVFVCALVVSIGSNWSLANPDLEGRTADFEELSLPEIDRTLYGVKIPEAVDQILQAEKLTRVVSRFHPKITGWTSQMEPVHYQDGMTHFRLHLKQQIAVQEANATGFWSYVSSASRYLTEWMVGDLVGTARRKEAICPFPYRQQGHLLEVDFRESSELIASRVQFLKVQVCLREASDHRSADLKFKINLVPGELFPGLDNLEAQELIVSQAEAWIAALIDETTLEDVALVQAELKRGL